MAKFSDLSLRAQRELMEEYRNKGINDLSDMIADYDREESSDTTSSGTSVSVPFSLAETYRNGGKIHIKPSKRGTFTAAATKHGKSVQAFASQVLAHPENYSPAMRKKANFARNAAKWHAEGGHIYDGYNEPFNKLWEVQYPEAPEEYNGGTLPAAVMTAPLPAKFNGSKAAARRYAEGYKWATENVTKPTNRIAHDYVAPALAATFAAPVAIDAAAAVVANPWLRLAADTAGNIDGIRNAASKNGVAKTIRLAKEGDTVGAIKSGIGDVLDIAGTSDLIRTASKFRGPNLRLHAFNSVEPFDYRDSHRKIGRLIKDVIEDTPVNLSSAPDWRLQGEGKTYANKLRYEYGLPEYRVNSIMDTREDAWRIYNGLPQRNNSYILNSDGTYSYNLDNVRKSIPSWRGMNVDLNTRHDDFLETHGGLWKDEFIPLGSDSDYGVRHIEDLWDLHPFSRTPVSKEAATLLKNTVGDLPVRNAVQRFRTAMYNKGYWSSYSDKANGLIGKATKWLDNPLNRFRSYTPNAKEVNGVWSNGRLDRFLDKAASFLKPFDAPLRKFEIGKFTGGKPFMMKTDIPVKRLDNTLGVFYGGNVDNVLADGGHIFAFGGQETDGELAVPLTLPQQNFMWNPERTPSGTATRKINRDTQEKEVTEKPSSTQLLDLETIGGIRNGVQPKRAAASREVSVPETVFTADTNNGIQKDVIFSDSLPVENFLGDTDSYKRTVPDRDARRYFQTEVGKLDYGIKEQRRQDYSKLPKTDIMAKQQELADAGLYEKQLEGLSKEEIKNIQTKLVNRGLLNNAKRSDGSYVEVDGIAGKRTKAAWNSYNVDGIWGKRSEIAESMQEKPSADTARWSDFYSAKGVDGCAKWVTRKFESVMGEVSQQNGVVGDAWQMPKNIVSAGGTMLFNIYDDPAFDNIVSENDLKTKTKDKLSKLKIDYSSLEPGDVVGIYMPLSNHHGDVLKNGTTYNTHVGIVTGKDSNGMPIVEHNIYGNNHKDLANNLRIVVAARPKNSVNVKEYPFTSGVSDYYVDNGKFNEASQPENLKSYMDSMAGAAPVIGKIYKNADMDAVQKIATAVLRRETGYMQNLESERGGTDAVLEKVEKFGRWVKGMNSDTKSSDLSKFKLSTLSPDERKFLGIKSKEDLDNPEKAGLASMLILAKNYDYFSRYAKQNPDLGMTVEDIENLTALSYNQGMGNLYRITKSGLERVRRSAENSEKVEDFDSTTLGRIADAFPVTAPLMQGLFNLGLGTRSTSYTYSARNAMNEQIKKKSGE